MWFKEVDDSDVVFGYDLVEYVVLIFYVWLVDGNWGEFDKLFVKKDKFVVFVEDGVIVDVLCIFFWYGMCVWFGLVYVFVVCLSKVWVEVFFECICWYFL